MRFLRVHNVLFWARHCFGGSSASMHACAVRFLSSLVDTRGGEVLPSRLRSRPLPFPTPFFPRNSHSFCLHTNHLMFGFTVPSPLSPSHFSLSPNDAFVEAPQNCSSHALPPFFYPEPLCGIPSLFGTMFRSPETRFWRGGSWTLGVGSSGGPER